MKAFIAYALVVGGIPILAGFLVGMIVTMVIGLVVHLFRPKLREDASQAEVMASIGSDHSPVKKQVANVILGFSSGLAAVLTAAFIFRSLDQPLGLAVLLIPAAWKVLYFSVAVRHGQPPIYLVSSLVGLGIGWYDVPRIFSLSP